VLLHGIRRYKQDERHTPVRERCQLLSAQPVEVVGNESCVGPGPAQTIEHLPGRETPLRDDELAGFVQRRQELTLALGIAESEREP
jgi:hypothetical protein